jgi:hypothetical protein
MRSKLFLLSLPLAMACGAQDNDTPNDTAELVTELQDQFNTPAQPPSGKTDDTTGTYPPLLPSAGDVLPEFAPDNGVVGFAARSSDPESPARIALAKTANAWSRVTDRNSTMSVSHRLVDAAAATAKVADGYAVYEAALGNEATVLSRPHAEGVEDYVHFATRPARAEVRYEVELSNGVAGLRLVANTLEMVDSTGDPRLRIAPPFLVDADKNTFPAELSVEGCSYDENPAAPWGREPVAAGADTCTVVVSWNDEKVQYPAVLDPDWTTTGQMTVARRSFVSILLSTGKVLVCAGSGNAPTNQSCELYDPAGNGGVGSFAATGSLPSPHYSRSAIAALLDANNRVMMAGGSTTGTVTAAAATYQPSTGVWTARPAVPHARFAHTLNRLSNGKIMALGGFDAGNGPVQAVDIYNPTTNLWEVGASASYTARGDHSTVKLSNGDILMIGGRTSFGGEFGVLNSTYSFNGTTWTNRGNLQVGRYCATATFYDNGTQSGILVAGGSKSLDDNLHGATARTEIFDGTAWRDGPDLITGRTLHTATHLGNGTVLFVGGVNDNSTTPVAMTELFKPTWETIIEAGNLAMPRDMHIAASIGTPLAPKVMVAGGYYTHNPSSSFTRNAEKYVPAAPVTVVAKDYFDGASAANPQRYSSTSDYSAPTIMGAYPGVQTEILGTMYYPSPMPAGSLKVIVMLHGRNHACVQDLPTPGLPALEYNEDAHAGGYSHTGSCPANYHLRRSDKGFEYLANELAAKNYFVVAISNELGFNLGGSPQNSFYIEARGKLVLKTLQYLKEWDNGTRGEPAGLPSLDGKLDLGHVGLIGHSRGGEGVRSALYQYNQSTTWQNTLPGLNVQGVFEIGSTSEGVTTSQGTVIDQETPGVPWALLMGTCDTNAFATNASAMVATTGMRVFDRSITSSSPAFRAQYIVAGANHNFYNTAWQWSDVEYASENPFPSNAKICKPSPLYPSNGLWGSARQRQTAINAVLHFVQAYVGNSPDLTQLAMFDPVTPAPADLWVSRSYRPANYTSQVISDFLNTLNLTISGLTVKADGGDDITDRTVDQGSTNHDSALGSGSFKWDNISGSNAYADEPFIYGWDFTPYSYFEFRVEREANDAYSGDLDFNVRLMDVVNNVVHQSPSIPVSAYLVNGDHTGIRRPGGIQYTDDILGTTICNVAPFQTVRMPLSAFTGIDKTKIRGYKFLFNRASSTGGTTGKVYITNVRATKP